MQDAAFQVHYPKETRHCYGCGTLNEHGLHIESFWDGEETVCRFKPRPYHTAIPGYVYGGLIASIIDCHSIGTAAANAYRAEGREMDTEPHFRFVTGSLQVDYLRPTPIGIELEVRGKATEIQERKIIVAARVFARKMQCARGKVIAVRMPSHWLANSGC